MDVISTVGCMGGLEGTSNQTSLVEALPGGHTTPVCVDVDDGRTKVTNKGLQHGYCVVPSAKESVLLYFFLEEESIALIFNGKRKQQKQTSTFFDVCKVEKDILLCTDTAAHGLDIPDVDWMHQKILCWDIDMIDHLDLGLRMSLFLYFIAILVRKPPGMRGSACVEVMTTLHGSAPSLRRRAEGCIPLEGLPPYTWVHLRAFRASVAAILDPIFPLFSLQIGPLFLVLIYLCGSEQWRSTFRIRIVTLSLVDQFTDAMASIQEALASLRQEIGGQQGRPPAVQDETPYDSHPPPPPLPVPSVHQASPYVLHGHSEITPPVVAQAAVADDTHARMDCIEQCMRQMRVSDGSVVWDDFGGMPVASLPAKFRMPDIERYTSIGCLRLHLRLYSTVMRAHGL
ncbi:DEAD-box ATP-dependent RNA helicase 51 [Vitis vinifera]|uniref:DEAD-box ATP-dependent RNA helicase 51 n=1 Tax=Vitis vinifera TaxID=29760 RepID=A0A438H7R8_VITVI|nr:DEAD-box ATP-dependent RNA helicase 51 [Vitis vinifera]